MRGYREEQFLTPVAWVIQSEWGWLQGADGSRLYLFVDVGFLGRPEGHGLRAVFDQTAVGTGVGVRQAGRLGALGVEYGWAKGENILDGRVHLRLDALF